VHLATVVPPSLAARSEFVMIDEIQVLRHISGELCVIDGRQQRPDSPGKIGSWQGEELIPALLHLLARRRLRRSRLNS
jgi:hypothetical protein